MNPFLRWFYQKTGFKSFNLMVIHPTLTTIILTNSFKKTHQLKQSLRLIYSGMFNQCGCTKSVTRASQLLRITPDQDKTTKDSKDPKDPQTPGCKGPERRFSAEICPPERLTLKKKLELKRKQTGTTDNSLSFQELSATPASVGPNLRPEARGFPFLSFMADTRRRA